MINPKEMKALKELAAHDLENALRAAARIGMTKSTTAAAPIKRAAAMLEYEAECIKESHTINGKWLGEPEAKADYDEFKKVARELREIGGAA
jgi:hypothetical protein